MTVFSYAFVPQLPMGNEDGGFTVNLLTNDQLVFNTYDVFNNVTSDVRFQLNSYTRDRYLRMVSYAKPWLSNVPQRMMGFEGKLEGVYKFGFNGMPMLEIENMQSLVMGPYRDPIAHYTRKVYSLMEDIATLLGAYGIDLRPDTFTWNERVIAPIPQMPQMAYYSNPA